MLSNRLDEYMAQLEHGLQALPESQRQEEIAEIRTHIEEMIAGYREMGLSEEQAFTDAERQFGEIAPLTRDLKRVHRKQFAKSLVEKFGALLGFYMLVRVSVLLMPPEQITQYWPGNILLTVAGLKSVLDGIILGRITRRANWAIGALLTYLMISLAIIIHQHPDIASRLFYANFPYHLGYAACSVVGAWIGSRWRERRHKRHRVFA